MEQPPPLPRRTLALAAALFLAAALLVYGFSLGNGFVRWDDGMLIYENPAIRSISPTTIAWIFTHYDPELYIPLTFLSYQIDYLLGGTAPFIYHLTSLLLHAGNAFLLVLVTLRLARRRDVALLAGLLFLLHPLHTEAVAWASGRKDVLSTFFFLLSILGYLRFRETESRRTYLASLAAFLCALLSKIMTATLPAALVIVDLLQGRKMDRKAWLEKLPYFALSVALLFVGLFGKRALVGATPMDVRVFMSAKSAVFYLQQIVRPLDFSVLYPFKGTASLASGAFLLNILVLLALVGAAAILWKRSRWPAFCTAFYLGTLAPTFLNIGNKGEMDVYFASDRYAYIPSIGVLLAIAWLLAMLGERLRLPRGRGTAAVGAVVLATLGLLSFRQSLLWRDTEALFGNVIRLYPGISHVAHNNLGNMYRLLGDLDRAVEELEKSLAVRPHAKTLANLGAVYRKQGKIDDAMAAYERALALDPKSPYAHFGLGIVLAERGRTGEAMASYRRAIDIDPFYEEAYVNLGAAAAKAGLWGEAIESYRKAIAVNALFPDAHYNLGVALAKTGDADGAIAAYRWVTELAPQFIPAHINLGLLLANAGEPEAARREFHDVLRLDPGNAAAKSALRQLGER